MLRAVLAGLLVMSTSACSKSSTESAAKVQPGVAAGKVLEVKGTVSVKRADATTPLATGDTVEGDDTVITGADGNIVIELAHNSARWELGPNKQQKVSESIAWKAKKATAEDVDQATAAAGRPAERSAAGTVAMANEESAAPAPPAEAAPAPAAAEPEPDMSPKGGDAPVERPRRRAAAPKPAAAPPPPPEPEADEEEAPRPRTTRGAIRKEVAVASAPPRAQQAESAPAPGGGGASDGGGGGASGGGAPAADAKIGVMARAVDPTAGQLATKHDALAKCVADHGAKQAVTLVVEVTGGKATVKLQSKAAISAALDKCIKGVVGSIQFTGSGKATRTIN